MCDTVRGGGGAEHESDCSCERGSSRQVMEEQQFSGPDVLRVPDKSFMREAAG